MFSPFKKSVHEFFVHLKDDYICNRSMAGVSKLFSMPTKTGNIKRPTGQPDECLTRATVMGGCDR